jgi:hypothetical protein
MRVTQVSLVSATQSSWIPHDYYQTPANIGLAGFISSGATLTYGVQFTLDDLGPGAERQVLTSQSTTVVTVTDNGPPGNGGTHGLSVGDYVRLYGTGIAGLDGEYVSVATIVSATQYTLTSLTSQTVSPAVPAKVITARVFTHAVLTAQTTRATGNYTVATRGSRLNVTAYTSGTATLEVLQGGMST